MIIIEKFKNSTNLPDKIQYANQLLCFSKDHYDKISCNYDDKRKKLSEFDKNIWRKISLLFEIQKNKGLIQTEKRPLLLDIGSGNGRDICYSQYVLGYKSIGVDNSLNCARIIKHHETNDEIEPGSILACDMRNLTFRSNTFDIVRYSASLNHMPCIKKGVMADKAVEEACRVLKPYGLLFILVKKGTGIELIDTGENLGERLFFLYDKSTLENLLERNGFRSIETESHIEVRNGDNIEWLTCISYKDSTV